MTNLEPIGRPPALILKVGPVVRQDCTAAGDDPTMGSGGVLKLLRVRNDYFAPDDVDPIY